MSFPKRTKITFFLCALLLIGSSIFFILERSHYNLISNKELKKIQEKLSILSPQERKDLAFFFNYAIIFCQYPYTLVDAKPMSICNYLQPADDLPQIFREDYERLQHRPFADTLEKGYCVWEKYQSLFPLKKYSLLKYHASESKGMKEIALIHHDLCKTVIQKNLNDFLEILGHQCKEGQILAILLKKDPENFYSIVEHDRLLGILLGFGRNNAYLFENKKRANLKSFSNERPIWPKKWLLPSFLCDPTTEETKHLKNQYRKARKHIRWTYYNRDNLEVTLALLSQE